MKAAEGKGKLSRDLEQQKRETTKQTMERFTQQTLRERDMDRTGEQLTYN